ncbi:4-phosphoerythronate dehydrogenase [Verrucomicrobiota bacterium]
MKIVCAANMPYAREAFSTLGCPVVLDGRAIAANDVRDAEVLAIRSTTRADRALLDGSAVRFVGTATIGTDHMDISYFERAGIRWCYSPGCNANSVAEYVAAALLSLADRHGFGLRGKTMGVIGVGNVGSLVAEKARTLGLRVLPNDPPRAAREGTALPWVSLDRVLAESDIVTLHVPLSREGPDATFHMAGREFFHRLKPGAVFLNCARGAVVETDALIEALVGGIVSHAVIDTWEGEPEYRTELLDRVDIGTPHIAGHSFEGKVMGTVMVYREVCRFLGLEPTWSPEALLPPPPRSQGSRPRRREGPKRAFCGTW